MKGRKYIMRSKKLVALMVALMMIIGLLPIMSVSAQTPQEHVIYITKAAQVGSFSEANNTGEQLFAATIDNGYFEGKIDGFRGWGRYLGGSHLGYGRQFYIKFELPDNETVDRNALRKVAIYLTPYEYNNLGNGEETSLVLYSIDPSINLTDTPVDSGTVNKDSYPYNKEFKVNSGLITKAMTSTPVEFDITEYVKKYPERTEFAFTGLAANAGIRVRGTTTDDEVKPKVVYVVDPVYEGIVEALGGYYKNKPISSDLDLPQSVAEADLTWESSNEDIINSQTGEVTQPLSTTSVTLTASYTEGEETYTYPFTFVVLGKPADGKIINVGGQYYVIKGSNLVSNGGFEEGFKDWTFADGSAELSSSFFNISDWALEGSKSLEIPNSNGYVKGGSEAYGIRSIRRVVKGIEPNKKYYVRFSVYRNGQEVISRPNQFTETIVALMNSLSQSVKDPYVQNANGELYGGISSAEFNDGFIVSDSRKIPGTDYPKMLVQDNRWYTAEYILNNDESADSVLFNFYYLCDFRGYIDAFEIYEVETSEEINALGQAVEGLIPGYTKGMAVSSDLTLPTAIDGLEDVTVTWKSSAEGAIGADGKVGKQGGKVVLTAAVEVEDKQYEYDFDLTTLGLVAHYTFDEGIVDGFIPDASGNGNDAQVINNEAEFTVENGQAKFPGYPQDSKLGAALKMPRSVPSAMTGSWTASMWVKQDPTYRTDKAIVFFDFGSGNFNRLFVQTQNATVIMQDRGGAGSRVIQTADIANQFKDTWRHFVVSVDVETGVANWYLDGQLVETIMDSGAKWTAVNSPARYAAAFNQYAAYIGRNQWHADGGQMNGNPDYKGYMDDIRFYNYAISADEVLEIYEQKAPGAATVKVEYVTEDGEELKESETINPGLFAGDSYTLTNAPAELVKDDVIYIPAQSEYKVTLAAGENVIRVTYVEKVDEIISENLKTEVIQGNTPVMPKAQVKIATESGEELIKTVDVNWNLGELVVGENPVTGTVGGQSVTATVIVYPCDEAVADVYDDTPSPDVIQLGRTYTGKIYTEFDIVVNKTGDNVTSYGDANATDGFSKSATNLQWKPDNNIVSRIGKNDTTATDFNTGVKYQDGVRYRVRTYIDTNGQSNYYATNQTRGNVSQTPDGVVNGNYRIFITPEGGEEFEATLPEVNGRAGNGFRANAQSISKFFAGTNGYGGIVTVTNHKISWLEGYVPVKIQRQFGEGEPEVVETLKNEPGKDFTYEAPESLYKDGIFYVLDKTNSALSYEAGVAGEEEVLTAVYVVDELEEVIPPTIVTRVGIAPQLPQYIQGTLKITGQTVSDVVAVWDEVSEELYATPTEEGEEREITGTASYGGKELEFTTKLVVKTVDDYKFVEYKFDGDLLDSSGKGNHGSFYVDRNLTQGTPLYVDGVGSTVSQGIDFGSGFVALPQTAVDEIKNASGLTMTTFVKKYNTGNQFLFTIANNYSTNVTNNSLGYIDSNNFRYETKDGVVRTNMRTSVDSKYVNVAVSVDFVTGNVSIYFDGELVANGTVRTTPQSVAAEMAAIGLSPWPNDQYYKGYVDNFTLYNTVLTDEEIAKLCGKHELTVKYETEDGTAVKDSDVYEDYYGFEFNEDIPSVIAYNNTLYIRTNDAEGVYGVDDEITVIYREVSSVEVHEVLYEPVGYKVPQGKDVPAPDKLFVKATLDNQFEYEAEFPVVWDYDPEEHEPGDVVTIKAYIVGADEPVAEDTVEVYYNFDTAYAYFRANGMDVVEGYLVYEGNKFANPSFEENFDGWYNVNASGQIVELPENWIRYDDIAADGTYSIGTTVRSGGQSAGSIIGFAPLNNGQPTKAGQKFLVSYKWYTVEGAMTSTIGLTTNINQTQVDESCGGTGNSGNSPVSSNLAGYPTNTWNTLLYILTANDYTTHAQIYNRWVGPYDRFDDFKCYELVLDANGNPIQISQDDCFAKFEAKVVDFDGTERVIAEGYNKVGVSIKVDVPELEDVVNDLGFVIARAVVNDVIALENVDNPVVVAGYEVVEELQVKLELDEEAKTATLKGINLTDADATVTLIIASYDEDNKLVEVKYQDVTFAAGEEDGNFVTLSLTEDAAVVKAFVWNSIKGLQPVEVIR